MRTGFVFVLLVGLGASLGAVADDGTVRVYTNADIERLAPLPTQPAPLVPFDSERWEYVVQFLEREHRKLESDRDHELDRAILDAQVEARRTSPAFYRLPVAPQIAYHIRGRRDSRERPRSDVGFATPPGERIVPLHARPSRAQLHFDRANGRVTN